MRIIAGSFKGRTLESPPDARIRPTSDFAREAIFNILGARKRADGTALLHGARVADLCCGTGAMGLEALSRGAAYAVFVDHAKAALSLAERNVQKCGAADQSSFLLADATTLPRVESPFDIVFMDPPYDQNLLPLILESLRAQSWVHAETIAVAEYQKDTQIELPSGWEIKDQRRYGRANISLLVCPAGDPGARR